MKVHWVNGVEKHHINTTTKPQQHKKNHNTTTKIHSTKQNTKTNHHDTRKQTTSSKMWEKRRVARKAIEDKLNPYINNQELMVDIVV